MSFSPLIQQLIEELCCLPGVGPKTAQRLAFSLLENKRREAKQLADTIHRAVEEIQHCEKCRTLCETEHCLICANPKRDSSLLCIVETPADIVAVEQTGIFKGFYFVLMGHLSPIDGIGPKELHLDLLAKHFNEPLLKEIILATNNTAEGEATAHYIAEMTKPFNLKVSRIARGVPLGGELTYVDSSTLAESLIKRNVV